MNQYLVDSPHTPFTIKNQFKAISNGKVYIGKVDKDPLNPSQQIQVYVVNESGSNVPVSQPISLNAGGYLVYNGQVSKFVTLEPYSMVVLNSIDAEMWRVDDISKVDPESFAHNQLKEINAVGGHDAIYSRQFDSVSLMKSAVGILHGSSIKTKFHTVHPYGAAIYDIITAAEYAAVTGLASPDNKRDHDIIGGYIAMLRPLNGVVTVQQCGAIPFDDSIETANINTDAFRAAHLSLKNEWDARFSTPTPLIWTTKVESGDYNLSNGYAVPKGMVSFSDSLGSSRIKILPITIDENPILPVISLGRVINGTATEVANGLYITNPPPKVHNLFINPQDTRAAVDITGIPGFEIGDLWLQAAQCVVLGLSTGDGIIGRLVIEDGSVSGIDFGTCQNILVDEIYTFNIQTPINISGDPNNITIGSVQANYSSVSGIQTNDGTNPRNFTIGTFIFNQNTQYEASPVRLRSSSCDIHIDRLEAYNYNGYAVINENGLGNIVKIGTAVLKQQRSNDAYTQGFGAKGFYANNCYIDVRRLESEGLRSASIGVVAGAFASKLIIGGGYAFGQVEVNVLVEISNTAASTVRVVDFDNQTGLAMYLPQNTVEVTFYNVKNPFPLVTENSRTAIKIPFNRGSLYNLTIRANTNPSGNPAYSKIAKYFASVEVLFNGSALVYKGEILEQYQGTGFGYVPDIALQVDINSVGNGNTGLYSTGFGYLVLSLPLGYGATSYSLQPDMA